MPVITVVVTEETSPFPPVYPEPLIYVMDVADPTDRDEVLNNIAILRYSELGGEHGDDGLTPDEDVELNAVREGLKIHFAFAGDVPTFVDYRS